MVRADFTIYSQYHALECVSMCTGMEPTSIQSHWCSGTCEILWNIHVFFICLKSFIRTIFYIYTSLVFLVLRIILAFARIYVGCCNKKLAFVLLQSQSITGKDTQIYFRIYSTSINISRDLKTIKQS